jgi:ELWxxDGT repeat protein
MSSLVAIGETIFFDASTPETGYELWRSDGTESGTILLADIAPGPATSDPRSMIAVGDVVFFTADDGARGRTLWRVGRATGAIRVIDASLGYTRLLGPGPERSLSLFRDLLFFPGDDGTHGSELWGYRY